MFKLKQRELTIGIVMVLVGAAYLWATHFVPDKPGVDSATVPTILGWLMCFLGVVQLRTAFALKGEAGAETVETPVDYGSLMKTVALIVAYAALLNTVGFLIMTVVYLFIQFIVLTPTDRKPAYVLYAVIAAVTAASVYALFRYAFDLVLPVGLIDLD
jgi:putative tricarboxylic transport membrane protein